MTNIGRKGLELWEEEDGFVYGVLHLPTVSDPRAIDGGIDASLRGRDARARRDAAAPRLLEAPRLVRGASVRSHSQRRMHADAGSGRPAPARRDGRQAP